MQFAAFETEGAYQLPDDLKTLSDNQRSQLASEWVCVTEPTGSDTRFCHMTSTITRRHYTAGVHKSRATKVCTEAPYTYTYIYIHTQGGSNMTGTDCV